MDYYSLKSLRHRNSAWKLLAASTAPLVISFLNKVFIIDNVRQISHVDLAIKLEEELHDLEIEIRDDNPDAEKKSSEQYINYWVSPECQWLRKIYINGREVAYELMPGASQAIIWIENLTNRPFIGTESRLNTVYSLLNQIVTGVESDPDVRLAELENRKSEIDAEIESIKGGNIPILNATSLKDRFQQAYQISRELQADFYVVDDQFIKIEAAARKSLAEAYSSKGKNLEVILNNTDVIENSHQAKNLQAFIEIIGSQKRYDELTALLDKVFTIPEIIEDNPDKGFRQMHVSLQAASSEVQKRKGLLNKQLRKHLDGHVAAENSRILELIKIVENKLLVVDKKDYRRPFIELSEHFVPFISALERNLYKVPVKSVMLNQEIEVGEGDLSDASALFSQSYVSEELLQSNIRMSSRGKSQVSLGQVIGEFPLTKGLAELIVYLQIAKSSNEAITIENDSEEISWEVNGIKKKVNVHKVIFMENINE